MTLIYKIGDLMDATEPVIVHGCNARGVMGSGVAKAIRERYPEAYQEYRKHFETSGLELGEIVTAWSGDRYIGNAITQADFGRDGRRYVSYDAISMVFWKLNDSLPWFRSTFGERPAYVAIPRIGAGLGGGDWSEIAARIDAETPDMDVVVYDLA